MSDVALFGDISSRLMRLSDILREHDSHEKAERLVELTANIELLSEELQNCWGGPMNDQHGRQAIFKQLVEVVDFNKILETGTYRGLTTEWLSHIFSGPVASCEIERLYFLQAKSRLENNESVELCLMDSREFLRRQLNTLGVNDACLIYLDAHWRDDLPLIEEIDIILASHKRCVIAIDDFKVPGDAGYAYDDYGPNKALTLELFKNLRDQNFRFYFPKLNSEQETGSVRGLCVMTNTMTDNLNKCDLLIGGDWTEWRLMELEGRVSKLSENIKSIEVLTSDMTGTLPNAPANQEALGNSCGLQLQGVLDSKFENLLSDINTILNSELVLKLEQALEMQNSQRQFIEDWASKIERRFDDVDERRELGRELVKERSKSLELQRQNHQLHEKLHQLIETHDDAQSRSGVESANLKMQNALAELDNLRNCVTGLKGSRSLKGLSYIAPNARNDVISIERLLDRAIAQLRQIS